MKKGVIFFENLKFTFLLIKLLFISFAVNSQVNTELFNRLNAPVVDCKTIAFNSQKLIAGYALEQTDSIAIVLNAWEELCGITEPTMRLRMLLDIKNACFEETKYETYFKYFIEKYDLRIKYSEDPDYQNPNSPFINYLNYVPANGPFDIFTKDLAYSLIDAQPQKSITHLLCILFTGDVLNFWQTYNELKGNDKVDNPIVQIPNRYSPSPNRYSFELYSLNAGVCFPSGKLSNSINPSPFFGLDFGGTIKKKYRLALDFKIVPISENSNILLHTTKDTSTTINSIVSVGLKLTQKNQVYKQFFVDVSVGAGVNSISTDLLKKPASGRNKDDTYYSLTTADFNGGISIRYKFIRGGSLSLFSEWHYAPYSWDKKSTPSIGNQYLLTGLQFTM